MTTRNSLLMTAATFEVIPGANITDIIREAIQIASENGYRYNNGALITFDFNGVNVSVKANSDPALILRDWSRAIKGYIDETVGPYPNRELSEYEKASDVLIEAGKECRR